MTKLTAAALLVTTLAGAGCVRAAARSAPATPLDVPPPPPRVVEVTEAETPVPGTLVDAPVAGAPSSRPRTVPRVDPPKPERPRPDPAPVTEVAPPVPPAEAPRASPATTLQTTPPEREAALEREILEMLRRAAANLARVDYGGLNNDARAQYDQSKRFSTQAEEALRAKNLVYAQNLADKAFTLAAQLAGR
jgi:hypothetical protein